MTQYLACERQPVLVEQLQNVIVELMSGLEVCEPESLPIEFEAVPQNIKGTLGIEFLDERVNKKAFQPRTMQFPHLLPDLGLRVLEESAYPGRKKRPIHIPFRSAALFPARLV